MPGDRCATREPARAGAAHGACPACALGPGGLSRCSLMVAESAVMREALAHAEPAARSDAPLILTGETGTGKEVLARAVHAASRRRGAFVAVNCGALPSELVESEIFGHARGAFSGALLDRRGLLEEADGGTLLLDELQDLPLAVQVKLLRVLQDGEVRPVGANHGRRVDVRFIAATNRDLRAEIAAGRFREDLYYRLSVFELRLPPLRDRRSDVLPLARFFVEAHGRPGLRLSRAAEEVLLARRWPGNVRELCNVIRRAAACTESAAILPEHLPPELAAASAGPSGPGAARPPVLRALAEVEREHVLAVLSACQGCHAEAARVLGIGRNTLWRKLASYGAAATPAGTPPESPAAAAGPAPR